MRKEMMGEAAADRAMLLSGGAPATGCTAGADAQAARAAQATDTIHTTASSASPRDTADVADAIRQAAETGTTLRLVGAGTWLDAGRPTDPLAHRLDLGALRGIVEYVPGDLTLTARAATSLAEIDAATRPFGQWLPLDPWGDPRGTLGAVLATAATGPLAAHLGHPRDLALGIEFVDGRGTTVRGGGRVVKNVAGFDLVRLTVGAWGTLGVITEATMRLRARPECERTLALHVPREPRALALVLGALRRAPITPLAMELADAALARRLGGTCDGACILVRLAGNAASVAAQAAAVADLGTTDELAADAWTAWASAGVAADDWTLRCSAPPSQLAELWDAVGSAAGAPADAWRHASVERGIVRVVVPAGAARRLPSIVAVLSARWRIIGERLPGDAWDRLAPAVADRLSVGVRRAFDPHRLLNRGILEGLTPA